MGKHIEITIGSARFQAVLEENGTAAAFLRELLLTVEMRELNGNEKYADLATPLPTSAETPGTIRCGDLMLYGSSTVVLFYENFSSPYRYTVLGHVENPDGLQVALGRGNPTVTFAAVPEEREKTARIRRRGHPAGKSFHADAGAEERHEDPDALRRYGHSRHSERR
ncbi:MAG: hypothetical protein L6W00_17165 [Lentisphaeria bacterium]|nr:MAG: hypothetical protein L6W00_17165 [Lentisphaeria bacterium]